MSDAAPDTGLKKSLGVVALTIYGVGNILGAGIYTLIDDAAGELGNAVWLAFLVSMVAAGLTGLSYASLGSRYPKAAGAAFITHRAFLMPVLAYLIGLVVMASGLTSMATTANGFADYFLTLTQWGPGAKAFVMIGLIAALTAINFWGLREAAWVNALCTFVETAGLLLIIAVGVRFWGSVDYLDATSVHNPSGEITGSLILTGAVLTFYSFIGFEDLLNVSEEVRNPRRTFPIALITALAIAGVIYMAVCVTVVSVMPHAELAASKAPLADVMKVAAPWFNAKLFTVLALFAVTNTALLNYIMGSRLAYGMSRQGLLPRFLGRLHPSRRTPHVAILALAAIVLVLIFSGDIKALANATSILLLSAFTVVNVALIVLQRRPGEPRGGFEVPWLVPAAGACVCLTMIAMRVITALRDNDTRALQIAGAIVAGIVVMYLILRPKHAAIEECEGDPTPDRDGPPPA